VQPEAKTFISTERWSKVSQ